MKNLIAVLLIALGLMSFKSPEAKNYNRKLTESQLKFIKENYNWNGENILIINFVQPKRNCFYDNYEHMNTSVNWWAKYYAKIDLTNITNIFVYSDKFAAKEVIDSKTHFEDKENFLLKNFFLNGSECYGVLIINKMGDYQKEDGEYSQKTVERDILKLKI